MRAIFVSIGGYGENTCLTISITDLKQWLTFYDLYHFSFLFILTGQSRHCMCSRLGGRMACRRTILDFRQSHGLQCNDSLCCVWLTEATTQRLMFKGYYCNYWHYNTSVYPVLLHSTQWRGFTQVALSTLDVCICPVVRHDNRLSIALAEINFECHSPKLQKNVYLQLHLEISVLFVVLLYLPKF